jgi:hypothetical protein
MPLLRWQPVDGAAFYRVQLDTRDAHVPGQIWDTYATSFIPPLDAYRSLGVDRWSWQVVACGAHIPDCPDWTPASARLRHFAITPRAIELKPTAATLEGEVTLEWEIPAPAPPAAGEPWEIIQQPAYIRLDVDTEPTFDSPGLQIATMRRGAARFASLPAGPVYWRVMLSDPPDAHGVVTDSFTYRFESEVVGPPNGTELQTPALVGWTPAPGAVAYRVEVDRNGWHPSIQGDEVSWTSALVGDDFVPGPMNWRITPIDAYGHRGSTTGGTIVVLPQNPILVEPLNGAQIPTVGAIFDWKGIDAAAGYRLQVSTDAGFSNIVETATTQRTRYVARVEYPSGPLWWRVRAESGYGQILGEVVGTSEIRTLTGVFVPLPPPDTASPIGTLSISGGAMFTKATTVTLSTAAIDAATGVAQVALSNDGTSWTTRPYAPTQSWTLPSTDGTRTVYAKWRDGAGNWSPVASDTIVLDTIAPTATTPSWRLVSGSTISLGRTTVRLGWTGSDATTGIGHYELAQSTDGGTWTSVSTSLTSASLDQLLAPGHTYRFRVRAIDQAGNVGSWIYGSTFRITAVSQSSSSVRYGGTWANSTSTTWWGGTARSSSTKGSTASFTFTGRSIAWVGLKAANRGKAYVYINGVLKATVDLYSATTLKQRLVWSASYSTSATRTITIRVLGTSGRPRVDVDGFLVGS